MTVTADAQPVLLMLVDISGYTKFMVSHDKELRHSQTIIGELLESLMHQVDVPLRISRIEGDALFLYAVRSGDEEVWRRRSGNLVDRLLSLFQVFKERLLEIGAYSVCKCDACAEVGDLQLKIIAHSGEALLTHVGEFPALSGVDVITVHRLAKNSVPEDEYVLLTEAAYRDLGLPADAVVRESSEEYDTGTFKTYVYLPDVDVEYDEEGHPGGLLERQRCRENPSRRDFEGVHRGCRQTGPRLPLQHRPGCTRDERLRRGLARGYRRRVDCFSFEHGEPVPHGSPRRRRVCRRYRFRGGSRLDHCCPCGGPGRPRHRRGHDPGDARQV